MSKLPQVFNHLMGGKEDGTLEKYLGPTYVRGLEIVSFAAPVDVSFFTVPDGPSDLQKKIEEGAQIVVNRHFYFEDNTLDINDKDRLTRQSVKFELKGVEPRKHGNFVYAYGISVQRASTDASGS